VRGSPATPNSVLGRQAVAARASRARNSAGSLASPNPAPRGIPSLPSRKQTFAAIPVRRNSVPTFQMVRRPQPAEIDRVYDILKVNSKAFQKLAKRKQQLYDSKLAKYDAGRFVLHPRKILKRQKGLTELMGLYDENSRRAAMTDSNIIAETFATIKRTRPGLYQQVYDRVRRDVERSRVRKAATERLAKKSREVQMKRNALMRVIL
jgi:hypothetical protein